MARPKGKKEGTEAKPGDLVRIESKGQSFEGILVPRASDGSQFISLKLPSGYNIGVCAKGAKIEVLKRGVAEFFGATDKKEKSMPPTCTEGKISLLACGGTIVNRVDYRTGAVYPASTTEELLAGMPQQFRSSIRPRMLFSIASEDMSAWHWKELALAAAQDIKEGAAGVVITHGTDTMHYTSAALSFMLQNLPVPVILTGSQRSSDRGSSDASQNLACSLAAAKADLSGVFVCMHEGISDGFCTLLFGTKTRKMHTSRRDAFRPINVPAAARISPDGDFERLSLSCPSRNPGAQLKVDTRLNENVAMQYIYPNIKPSAIAALSDYDGVVLVGTGLGHIPVNLGKDQHSIPILKEVRALIDSGIPVVLASQCIYGRINMNVYTNGRILLEAGVIGNLCDMTPETAYVKLMWVLGHEKRMEKVKEEMEKSIAGEISERTEIMPY
jgi:glutamyl-tRNA(Gln) amidotransferase subunit D